VSGVPATVMGALIVIGLLAAAAPDPGSADFPAFTAILLGTVATGLGLALGAPREEVEWYGLMGTFVGAVGGLLIYFFGLVSNLY
jgi:hypothetical protein